MGKIKDKIINIYYNVVNWILYNICNIKYGDFKLPEDYKLHYFDNFMEMTNEDLDDKYIRRQVWGDYHDKDLQQWYDPKAVSLNNGLCLHITENTKIVTSYSIDGSLQDNQVPVTIPNGVGLVTSKQDFGYGIYEWNIKLPKGKQLWPAIWLTGSKSWPPEVDILEGYSDNNDKYNRNLNTNIHCGHSSPEHYGVGANRHGLFVDHNSNLNLVCHWTEKYIKIYYNGFLCRVLTNKDDLKWFVDNKMLVIMNNALRVKTGNILSEVAKEPMIVFGFKYFNIY